MNYLYAFVVALIASVVGAVEESGPFDLNVHTFDQVINGNSMALVKFFSPHCGHCRQMEPAYKELASHFQHNGRVIIARVNCQAHPGLCQRFGISGLPTLKFFPASPNPQAQDAQCGRDVGSMRNFVESKLGSLHAGPVYIKLLSWSEECATSRSRLAKF